jgi:hypothetical protein
VVNAFGRTGNGVHNAGSRVAGDFGGMIQERLSKVMDGNNKSAAVKSEAASEADPFEMLWGAGGALQRTREQFAAMRGGACDTGSVSDAAGNTPVNFDLTNKVIDGSKIEARGNRDGFADDPELGAYGRQLALESGIGFGNGGDAGEAKGRQENFLYQLSRLLDRGLISRQDIIDAAEYPPMQYRKDDGSYGYEVDMRGYAKNGKNI